MRLDSYDFHCPTGQYVTQISGIINMEAQQAPATGNWRYVGALGPIQCNGGSTFLRAGGPDGTPFRLTSSAGFSRVDISYQEEDSFNESCW